MRVDFKCLQFMYFIHTSILFLCHFALFTVWNGVVFVLQVYAYFRMGLAISLVSAHPEKVWYHKCSSRGINCFNTALITERGCAIWYDEPKVRFSIYLNFFEKLEIITCFSG